MSTSPAEVAVFRSRTTTAVKWANKSYNKEEEAMRGRKQRSADRQVKRLLLPS